jgi:hypothetical protein
MVNQEVINGNLKILKLEFGQVIFYKILIKLVYEQQLVWEKPKGEKGVIPY